MSGNTDAVRAWTGADVLAGDVGATAPTNVSTAWGNDWDPLGLISEDGITESRSETADKKFAFGGVFVRTLKSKHERTFKVKALEDNLLVRSLVEPNSTFALSGGITTQAVSVPTLTTRFHAFGFELRDGTTIERIHIAKGEIVTVGDRVISDSNLAERELTITVYPSGSGLLYTSISNDAYASLVDSQ